MSALSHRTGYRAYTPSLWQVGDGFSDTQIREVFHFYFLDRLLKQSDPGLYILKGGVNLRFFFGSPRYSETSLIDAEIALAGRPVTQARDVFDLAILIIGGNRAQGPAARLLKEKDYTRALDCLTSLGWEDYDGQVVEFLDDDSREEYGDKPAWEMMQIQVMNELEANA